MLLLSWTCIKYMTTCEDRSQLFWFNYRSIKKIAWYFSSESVCTEMQAIRIEKILSLSTLKNYVIYRCIPELSSQLKHTWKWYCLFFLCQSMLTCCLFIELFDHSWYFSLSVINIFTRRNPHLKSLAKEGKVLMAFSRLCTLGCVYSANYVPKSFQYKSFHSSSEIAQKFWSPQV